MRKRNTLFMKIEPPKIIIPVLIKIEIKTDDIANSYYLYPICCREHINRGNQNPGSRTTTTQSEHTVLDTTPATQPYIVNRPRTSSSQRCLRGERYEIPESKMTCDVIFKLFATKDKKLYELIEIILITRDVTCSSTIHPCK